MAPVLPVLFVCSVNIVRSKTAERLFNGRFGHQLHAKSAGTSDLARVQVTRGLIANARAILVMEDHHRDKLVKRFPRDTRRKPIHVLGIEDIYEPDQVELIALLLERVPQALGLTLNAGPTPPRISGSLW